MAAARAESGWRSGRIWARIGSRLPVALFAVAVGLAVWNFAATSADRGRISVQNRIVLTMEKLLSSARDMETGSRGYVLVGSDGYLDPYRASMASFDGAAQDVRAAWMEGGGSAEALSPLFGALDRKRAYTTQLVETRRRDGPEAALGLVGSGIGKETMDAIRGEVARFQAAATEQRRTIERRDRTRSAILSVLSIVTALAACAYLGWLAWYRRSLVQRAEVELAGLGDRFQMMADNIPQLAWMADGKGEIYWFNRRWYEYTGMGVEDMMKGGWAKVHDPKFLEAASNRFFESVQSGEPWEDTFPLRGADGEYRWFLSRAEPVRDPGGTVRGWFGTNTDVTEQRRQEQELAAAKVAAEEANQAKSTFIANMSHELRTPLSAVIGYSEMLEEEVEELGERHLLNDLAKIKSNARHLLSLINDVLDISKIEANKMEVYAETFEVAAMARDVASTVGSIVDKKGNALVLDLPDDLGAMHSDVVKIRQILINLLSNSAKFTERGTITLGARRERVAAGEEVVFFVADTGLGMNEEQVAKLFQRFTQADASTTRRFGGTGLGLAITKAFSDMLGGRVAVESRPGEVSRFTLAVPVDLPTPAAVDVEAVEAVAAEEDVILVVDDDAATRDLLTRFLTREGFTVRVAADGRSGLALAGALKPKVVILDVTMPRMDGWTVLRALKDDPHLAAIPVVMCTIIDEQNLGFSLGASDYLLKPVNWDRLKEVLERVAKDAPKGDVLVVDDDADTRGRLDTLLARNGWTVSEAENGRAALEAARVRRPSLVLLDLNMPEMDGFTFLRQFRADPDWATIPVVVMTARDLSAAERAELKGGGARVVAKGSTSLVDLVGQLRALPGNRGRSPARVPEAELLG